MTQQIINIGSAANDGTGDKLRVAFDKVNDNFTELYASGDKGAKGDAGAQGQKGEPGAGGGGGGAQGAQGVQGDVGAQGAQGLQGVQGDVGVKGDKGEAGSKGEIGAQGVAGSGVQGDAGAKGDKGDVGSQGEQGAQGQKGESGGGSANTANVTFQDNIVIGTGDAELGMPGLFLSAGNSQIANLQYIRLRGGDDPTHIHFDTANAEQYDFYFGDDNKFVKLEHGFSGNVLIAPWSLNSAIWNFTTDRILKVPGAVNFQQNATIPLGKPTANGANDRITLWDFEGAGSGYNYAIGAEGNHMWFTMDVDNGTGGFKFYSRDTEIFKIRDDGALVFSDTTVQNTAYTGTSGPQGEQGVQGAIGVQGAAGSQGVQGEIGAQGSIGAQGVQGAIGEQGLAGVQGATGAQGAQGLQGVQGTVGTKGDKGEIGAQGLSGDFSGASFSYAYITNTANTDPGVGTLKFNNSELVDATELYIDDADKNATDIQSFIRTIDDSSSTIKGHFRVSLLSNSAVFALYTISSLHENSGYYTVNCAYISGSESTFENSDNVAITFARTGDRGDKGSVGNQGIQGAAGPQGDQGAQGHQGVLGAQGDPGVQGDLGAQGEQGFQGHQGEQGFQGNDGVQGAQGEQGFQGHQGIQGAIGSGAQGVQGEQGHQGVAGIVSFPLANGTSNVNIATANGAVTVTANTFIWSFDDTNGSIDLPGNVTNFEACSAINFVANSSGDGAGYSTIELRPDSNAVNDQYLIIDPTVVNHIHIRAGGTQDNSNAQIFLGGEYSNFSIGSGLNPSAYVTANQKTWTFETVGAFANPVVQYSNLPPASTAGIRAFISDANTSAPGNFGAVVSGGGANSVPVFSDGTDWRIG